MNLHLWLYVPQVQVLIFSLNITYTFTRWDLKYKLVGSVAKNLAILQNQSKTSQIGYLFAINMSIMIQKAIV